MVIGSLIVAYLCGSIPTAIWVGRIARGIDIREHGSGNAGATNAYRVLGWKLALIVVFVDVLKGFLPTWAVSQWFMPNPPLLQIGVGMAAISGHVWTIFAGFRGGKGVGTAAGVLLALYPVAVPICLAVFACVVWRSGMVSLASMCAVATLPASLWVLQQFFGYRIQTELWVLAIGIVPFVVFTHRSNIGRILRGEEHRFGRSKS
ncbi:MAG: glycerol-3-phosphate 1-O-acyltransferase PlsY [Acidobacteria bacterium]|nr:glycerol-3-phosphate 1-O-acyltransferase PlsY [Acidobacteriota bacterium]